MIPWILLSHAGGPQRACESPDRLTGWNARLRGRCSEAVRPAIVTCGPVRAVLCAWVHSRARAAPLWGGSTCESDAGFSVRGRTFGARKKRDRPTDARAHTRTNGEIHARLCPRRNICGDRSAGLSVRVCRWAFRKLRCARRTPLCNLCSARTVAFPALDYRALPHSGSGRVTRGASRTTLTRAHFHMHTAPRGPETGSNITDGHVRPSM